MKRNVQIQTTTACPGSCVFCGRRTARWAKADVLMSNKVFWATLTWLHEFDIGTICMYFQNEPLADKHLAQRIARAIEVCTPRKIEVSTNCMLLDKSRRSSLIAALRDYPSDIWLSFHGSNQNVYERKMGLPWYKCKQQLELFLEESDDIPSMRRLIVSNDTKNAKGRFWEPMFERLKLRRPPDLQIFRSPNARAGNAIGIKPHRRNDESWRNCARLRWWCINYKGDLVLCCMDYQHEVVFGNVLKDSPVVVEERAKSILERLSASRRFICYRCSGGKTMFKWKEPKHANS